MRRGIAVLTLALLAAQVAAAQTPDRWDRRWDGEERNGRGALFWTGLGLLAGGVGLATAGALRWESHPMRGDGGGSMMAMTTMMMGPWPGQNTTGWMLPGTHLPTGHDMPFAHGSPGQPRDNTLNAVAVGVGASAAVAGVAMLLRSRHDPRPVRLQPGLGRIDLVCSF